MEEPPCSRSQERFPSAVWAGEEPGQPQGCLEKHPRKGGGCSQEGQTESGEIQIKPRGVCHWRAGAGGMELGQARKRSMVWEERREVAGWVRGQGLKAGRWLLDQTTAAHLD